MAQQEFYHDISLEQVSQLLNARIHNISTSDRTTLGGLLNSTNEGLIVWDTDLKSQFFWNGTDWVNGIEPITGAMV